MTYKAYWLSLMDADTEIEFDGGDGPFFGTEDELEAHIERLERDTSYDCNIAVLECEYTPEDIAYSIMQQRLWHTFILPSSYDSLDVASDLFHMYDVWVDTDFCSEILPHIKALMEAKYNKRRAELEAHYGAPTYCNEDGMITLSCPAVQ